jgi:hypothetical protein
MASYRTVLHLPVTFVLPAGITPEGYAKLLADEAALDLENTGAADGDIEVADTSHDPVTDAYRQPSAAEGSGQS